MIVRLLSISKTVILKFTLLLLLKSTLFLCFLQSPESDFSYSINSVEQINTNGSIFYDADYFLLGDDGELYLIKNDDLKSVDRFQVRLLY